MECLPQALGEYTQSAGDFSKFPDRVILPNRRGGDLYYEPHTSSYIDDEAEYKVILAMCRLTCSICEGEGGARAHGVLFSSVAALSAHTWGSHRLKMCGLCLEGRKVRL